VARIAREVNARRERWLADDGPRDARRWRVITHMSANRSRVECRYILRVLEEGIENESRPPASLGIARKMRQQPRELRRARF
jgi:hypothetical protein